MSTKALLLAVSAVLLAQIAQGLTLERTKQDRHDGRYVTIDGHRYFYTGWQDTSRENAITKCSSLNMTMVTFENKETMLSLGNFLSNSYHYGMCYWMGAAREEGSSTWYWEETNKEIENFFWRSEEPHLNQNLNRTCLEFTASFEYSGWGDIECNLSCDIMCE